MEELLEIITWAQLGIHKKTVLENPISPFVKTVIMMWECCIVSAGWSFEC